MPCNINVRCTLASVSCKINMFPPQITTADQLPYLTSKLALEKFSDCLSRKSDFGGEGKSSWIFISKVGIFKFQLQMQSTINFTVPSLKYNKIQTWSLNSNLDNLRSWSSAAVSIQVEGVILHTANVTNSAFQPQFVMMFMNFREKYNF